MPQIGTYRGYCLLVGLAVADASMRTYRGYCLLEGLAVADASNEDLQMLLPTGETYCCRCLKLGLTEAIAYR
jgi:hypothetical protein